MTHQCPLDYSMPSTRAVCEAVEELGVQGWRVNLHYLTSRLTGCAPSLIEEDAVCSHQHRYAQPSTQAHTTHSNIGSSSCTDPAGLGRLLHSPPSQLSGSPLSAIEEEGKEAVASHARVQTGLGRGQETVEELVVPAQQKEEQRET